MYQNIRAKHSSATNKVITWKLLTQGTKMAQKQPIVGKLISSKRSSICKVIDAKELPKSYSRKKTVAPKMSTSTIAFAQTPKTYSVCLRQNQHKDKLFRSNKKDKYSYSQIQQQRKQNCESSNKAQIEFLNHRLQEEMQKSKQLRVLLQEYKELVKKFQIQSNEKIVCANQSRENAYSQTIQLQESQKHIDRVKISFRGEDDYPNSQIYLHKQQLCEKQLEVKYFKDKLKTNEENLQHIREEHKRQMDNLKITLQIQSIKKLKEQTNTYVEINEQTNKIIANLKWESSEKDILIQKLYKRVDRVNKNAEETIAIYDKSMTEKQNWIEQLEAEGEKKMKKLQKEHQKQIKEIEFKSQSQIKTLKERIDEMKIMLQNKNKDIEQLIKIKDETIRDLNKRAQRLMHYKVIVQKQISNAAAGINRVRTDEAYYGKENNHHNITTQPKESIFGSTNVNIPEIKTHSLCSSPEKKKEFNLSSLSKYFKF